VVHEGRFDGIATAHTLDDQAETVLLKFVRGAGTRGLAGIFPERQIESCGVQGRGKDVRIIRPLLSVTRAEVEAYLTSLSQCWREDETNLDRRFLRNRVRHELLPLLEREYNPNLRQLLSDLSDLARAEEDYWTNPVAAHLATHTSSGRLHLQGFAALPLAMQRRVIRRFAEQHALALDFEHVENLRRCALGELRRTELPGGRLAVNESSSLRICEFKPEDTRAYSYVLPIPGEVRIPELEITLRAQIVDQEFAREFAGGALLKRDLLGPELTIRNWMPGDRFHPVHQRSEEKLKRLFAEEKIPAEQRRTWPVGLHNGDIVWVRDLPVASAYAWKGEGEAVAVDTITPASPITGAVSVRL
jgi:tRNA(Ile)-lysidine synthase